MKIECPNCKFASNVPDEKIPETGASVACPKCKTKFQISRLPTVVTKTTLNCPKCGFSQDNSDRCISCGIVFQKYSNSNAQKKKETNPNIRQVPLNTASLKAEKSKDGMTEGGSNQKLIIGALVAIIVCLGGYLLFKKDTVKVVEQPKPVYVVQQNPAPAYNPGDPNPQTQTAEGASSAPPQSTPSNQSKKTVPQVAIDAVNALKKLQARTQVGIAYKDYAPALGEVKYAINLFTESQTAKEFPELVASISSSFETFKMAGSVWDDKFKGSSLERIVLKRYHPDILAKFPDADRDMTSGGIIFKGSDAEYISIETAISFLFSKANEEVQKASGMIAR